MKYCELSACNYIGVFQWHNFNFITFLIRPELLFAQENIPEFLNDKHFHYSNLNFIGFYVINRNIKCSLLNTQLIDEVVTTGSQKQKCG